MRRLRPWIPAILWAVWISVASTDAFSAVHTSRIIVPLLHWLLPHASKARLNELHHLIRKAAHLVEYFVFSLFLVHALKGPGRKWQLRWALFALAIAAGYSCLDEFHQWFVPSRGASPWDSLLDTCGAAAAQVVAWLWSRRGRGANA